MNISLLCWIAAGACLLAAVLLEGFGPLVFNASAEDRRGMHALTGCICIIGGFFVYGALHAAQ